MDEPKVHYHVDEKEADRTRQNYPPPYSRGNYALPSPDPFGPSMVHATTSARSEGVGVATGVNIVGPNFGVVGTNVGIVGTNVGVVGTNVGIVETTGMVTTVYPAVMMRQISPKPTYLTCKSCHKQIVTRIESKPTTKTHLFAGLLCLMGCWCFVCVPYFTDSCMNRDHYCPNCHAFIGSYVP